MGIIIFLHTVVAVLLVMIILMQSGRGGGLTEAFSPAESLFGAKTNIFMVRGTAVLAGIFLTTSLTLAYLSSKKERSLMTDQPFRQTPAEATATNSNGPDAFHQETGPSDSQSINAMIGTPQTTQTTQDAHQEKTNPE